jgi:hypothetical protein
MASVRFIDVQARPTEFLDLTSVTLDEFQLLIPPFEAAFHAHALIAPLLYFAISGVDVILLGPLHPLSERARLSCSFLS